MKIFTKCLSVAAIILVLSSCKSTYTALETFYQVAQTTLTEASMARYDVSINAYVYEDENVRIVYDLWSVGGVSCCNVINKTDEIIYLDTDKSFLVINGYSNTYYQPKYTEVENVTTGNLACRAIAPKSRYELPGLYFGYTQYLDCGFELTPQEDEPVTIRFEQGNTPDLYRSIVTYRVGNNPAEHMTTCEFYISSITNYLSKDIETTSRENGYPCYNNFEQGKNEVTIVTTMLYSPATAFYVKYNHTVTKSYK